MVECLHRRLKDALRARCSDLDWPNHHPWVLLMLRTMPWEDDGFSPAQAVYGTPLTLPVGRQDALWSRQWRRCTSPAMQQHPQ